MKVFALFFLGLVIVCPLRAADFSKLPPSGNVIDLRPVPVACAKPRNCAAGLIGSCQWGTQLRNSGWCRSDVRTACYIQRESCGNLKLRNECQDKCLAEQDLCEEKLAKHLPDTIEEAAAGLKACADQFKSCRETCSGL